MCGLVYSQNFDGKPVNNDILEQFDKQRARGTDGFGLFDGSKGNIVRSTKEDKILKWLCKYDSNLIMFHHRYPTSTANTKQNAHPFTTKKHFGDNQYILIHNGNVRNAWSVKDDHKKLGIQYRTQDGNKFVDSESLLWDFALYSEGKQKYLKSYGDIAFICVKLIKGKMSKLYFGRNGGRPLKLFRDKKEFFLSSEGKGSDLGTDILYTWDYNTKRLTKKTLKIPQYYYQTEDYEPPAGNYQSNYRSNYRTTASSGWKYPGSDWEAPEIIHHRAEQDALEAVKDHYEQEVLEYEHDPDTQELVPVVTSKEVDNLILEYLDSCGGEFELAYWAIEADYDALNEQEDTDIVIKERIQLEKAMEALSSDEEYLAGVRYSSVWQNLRHQKQFKDSSFTGALLAERLRRKTA